MARQLPEASESQKSPSQNGVGMYGSYYKVYRCSDGKYRLNLISEDEYVESKKRPISVSDVSSTTDVACSHRSSPLLTSSPCSSLPGSAVCGPLSSTSAATTRSRLPAATQRIAKAKTTAQNVPHHQRAPVRRGRKHPCNRGDAVATDQHATVATTGTEHDDHPVKRQRRDRIARSTVAVADLIAEYIPADVPVLAPVQESVASSTDCGTSASAQSTSTPLWNNWIKSVARRFPMADMSVRQVLDVLDSRPDLTLTED